MFAFQLVYSFLLSIIATLVAPAWFIKMQKRGGVGSGLIQRLAIHKDRASATHYQGADYYHAVSVGEVTMALKVIKEIKKLTPNYRAIIAATTATGHQVAKAQNLHQVKVIYAPLDFTWCIHKVFTLFTPKQLILVDSEIWPNLLLYTKKRQLPVKIINGRISGRSYPRFLKFQPLLSKLIGHINSVCVDGAEQVERWHTLGIKKTALLDVGSLKFDFSTEHPKAPDEFIAQLESFGQNLPTIALLSTHAGEEKLLCTELQKLQMPFKLMIIPRHAERRDEIESELKLIGINCVRRTAFPSHPQTTHQTAFLIDTTGELARWLPLIDLALIGKSWLKKGGQNPFESAILGVPTITGPFMENFEPLFSELVQNEGAIQLSQPDELSTTLGPLLSSPELRNQLGQRSVNYLATKSGATEKTAHVILNK